MLEILFLILKLLCYFVLFVLGFCILLLCLALFMPLKYSSEGYKKESDWKVSAKVTYLNPLLRVKIFYPAENAITTKVFGFTLKKKEKEEKPEEKTDKEKTSIEKKTVQKKATSKKKRKFSFVKDINYYLTLWQENQELIMDVLHTVVKALATILPKDMHVRVVYGTGMADVTGFIYAIFCSLQSYLPEDIDVEPLWIEKHLEGEYRLRGKIRLFPLVVAAVKIISNKNVRILYKKLRRV